MKTGIHTFRADANRVRADSAVRFSEVPLASTLVGGSVMSGDAGMKLLPKVFCRGIAAAVLAAALVATSSVRAAGPIEVDSPPTGDGPNQVLEIPQNCTLDGAQVPCDQSNAAPDGDPAASGVTADNGGSTTAATSPTTGDADFADQTATQDWGTVQEYEQQSDMTGPVASAVIPFGAGAMPSEVYVSRPMLAPAPVPVPFAPFVAAPGPFVPRVIAAPGPILGARPAWAMVPRPFAPVAPMTIIRPMAPMGMPHMFRTR